VAEKLWKEPDSSTGDSELALGSLMVRFSPQALLSYERPMRVLFRISILALVALLWASIAIVRHVRQARRRPDRESQQDATKGSKGQL